jgi:hypothetical protein
MRPDGETGPYFQVALVTVLSCFEGCQLFTIADRERIQKILRSILRKTAFFAATYDVRTLLLEHGSRPMVSQDILYVHHLHRDHGGCCQRGSQDKSEPAQEYPQQYLHAYDKGGWQINHSLL